MRELKKAFSVRDLDYYIVPIRDFGTEGISEDCRHIIRGRMIDMVVVVCLPFARIGEQSHSR